MGGFATCSNDGTVVMRTGDGVAVGTSCHPRQHDGSPPFVLDWLVIIPFFYVSFLLIFNCNKSYLLDELCMISALLDTTSGLDVVSVGEDGSVCVWQGTELVQCIQHPTSVWCALAVPRSGGDFITCGHDGVLRVFSRQPVSADDLERSQALQFQLKTQVQDSQKRKQQGPSQDEIQKAKRWEDRGSVAGKSDNAVSFINTHFKIQFIYSFIHLLLVYLINILGDGFQQRW